MDLVPAVITDSGWLERGSRGGKRGEGDVAGGLEKVEVRDVEKRRGARRTGAAKDATAFTTVL